jgi:hypothetical protein
MRSRVGSQRQQNRSRFKCRHLQLDIERAQPLRVWIPHVGVHFALIIFFQNRVARITIH